MNRYWDEYWSQPERIICLDCGDKFGPPFYKDVPGGQVCIDCWYERPESERGSEREAS